MSNLEKIALVAGGGVLAAGALTGCSTKPTEHTVDFDVSCPADTDPKVLEVEQSYANDAFSIGCVAVNGEHHAPISITYEMDATKSDGDFVVTTVTPATRRSPEISTSISENFGVVLISGNGTELVSVKSNEANK